jgi:hypothetical protein
MEIPNDTTLDLSLETRDISEKARRLMKALYLGHPALVQCADTHGWTPTQLVDAAETLRKAGFLRIEVERAALIKDYKYKVVITPTGATQAWLQEKAKS